MTKRRRTPRESLLHELPRAADGVAPGAAARARPGRRAIALLGLLLALAAGVAAERIGTNALAASTGPLSWTAPVLVDHQYPYDAGSTPSFDTLSCTATSVCLGDTGSSGDLVGSTDPSGASPSDWSVLPTTLLTQSASGYSLDGTSCVTDASGPFCIAGGFDPAASSGAILTTTSPTGGLSAFTPELFPAGELDDPACAPGATVCIGAAFPTSSATESLYVSATPTSVPWTAIPVSGTSNTASPNVEVKGIACPTGKGCIAVLSNGKWLGSATPTSATSWSAPAATGLTSIFSLTCASQTFCLAYGTNANDAPAIATTATEPGARWTLPTTTGFGGVVSSQISCFADDSAGSGVLCIAGTAGSSGDGVPGGLLVSVDKGVTWTAETLTGYTGLPQAFNCPSSGAQCFIGTDTGAVITGTDVDNVGHAASFSAPVGALPGTNELFSLACPSTSLCVGADLAGNLVSETNGNPGAAVSWSAANIDSPLNVLYAVACAPSTSLCVGADSQGNILTSTNPAGGASAWSKPESVDPGNGISGVACPSSSLCVAVDSSGNALTSTAPATGTWSKPASTGVADDLGAVSCAPGTTLCVAKGANGGLIVSPDPATSSWSAVDPANDTYLLDGISCPAASLCVAVDDRGDVLTSTNPTGGASAWVETTPIDPDGLDNLTCPSVSLCVADDYIGDVVASTNPTGGAGAWSAPTIVDPQSPLFSLACTPDGTQCLGGDLRGGVAAATLNPVSPPPVTSAAATGGGGGAPRRAPPRRRAQRAPRPAAPARPRPRRRHRHRCPRRCSARRSTSPRSVAPC